jgi:hypothetical protein
MVDGLRAERVGVRAIGGFVPVLEAVVAANGCHDARHFLALRNFLRLLPLRVPEGTVWTPGAEPSHVGATQRLAHVPLAALGPVLAVTTRVPGTFDRLVLGPDVQELAVVLSALTFGEEVTQRHTLHIVLVQVVAVVAFLALAPQPVFAYIRSRLALVPEEALVALPTHTSRKPRTHLRPARPVSDCEVLLGLGLLNVLL